MFKVSRDIVGHCCDAWNSLIDQLRNVALLGDRPADEGDNAAQFGQFGYFVQSRVQWGVNQGVSGHAFCDPSYSFSSRQAR